MASRRRLASSTRRKLSLNEAPVVTVIGKAFWDIGRPPRDQSNRRKRSPELRRVGDSPGNEAGPSVIFDSHQIVLPIKRNSPMTPYLSDFSPVRGRIRRNNSVKYYGQISSISR